jgi:nucleoside-diphosphate-sugar epimerase
MKDLIAITGSSGLIGAATARRLAPRYDVIGLDSKAPRHLGPLIEHVHLDLTRDDSVETAFKYLLATHGQRIASVIHLAAYYDFSGEPSPLYEEVTVKGTARLLRALQLFEVEQLVFSSSMLVHAPCEKGQRLNEDAALLPKWDYPKSKVDTEQLLRDQDGAIPLVILRIAGVYDDVCHSIPLAHQIQRIYEKRLIGRVFPGDTSTGQAFVHLDDLVEALASTVEHRRSLPRPTTLLIGEPETPSYDELQRLISRTLHGEEWETRQIPKAMAKAGAWLQDQVAGEEPFIKPWMIDLADDHYALDIARARMLLEWAPRHALIESVPRMLRGLQTDPEGWYREHKLELPKGLAEPARPEHGQPQAP